MNFRICWRILISLFSVFSLQAAETFYSQCGQDEFLYRTFFKGKTDGTFIDIGAHDGVTYNNTYFFEKNLGWKGICIEPHPDVFNQLKNNRHCVCVEGCIYDKSATVKFLKVVSHIGEHTNMLSGILENYDDRHLMRVQSEISEGKGACETIEVKCYKINDLLKQQGIKHIDYLSLDIEGGELDVLKSIDYDAYEIDVIDVENNYKTDEFEKFLTQKGFEKFKTLAWDDIYVRKGFKSNS